MKKATTQEPFISSSLFSKRCKKENEHLDKGWIHKVTLKLDGNQHKQR